MLLRHQKIAPSTASVPVAKELNHLLQQPHRLLLEGNILIMLIYLVTAILVFSLIAYVFLQDEESRKDDITSWLFIAFAASIWPLTLPNMIRKIVAKWNRSRRYAHLCQRNKSTPFLVFETSQNRALK